MGDVYWGVHLPLAAAVAQHGVRVAIETGTYFGSGAIHLSALFDQVVTIDSSPRSVDFCRETYGKSLPNVEFMCGDSGRLLPEIIHRYEDAVMLFLDAHWFPGAHAPQIGVSQCPLVLELEAIDRSEILRRTESVVIIDDADMFLRSLPEQFRDEEFPSMPEVLDGLRDSGASYVGVCDDVILAGPPWLRGLEERYLMARRVVGRPHTKSV